MTHLRAVGRLIRLIGVIIACAIPHLIARTGGQSPWPRRFLARACRAVGFDVHIEGTPLLHDVFFISNHLSWIDILSLGGVTGCAFISKDSVAKAPVVGWLAEQNNTIFVARDRRRAIVLFCSASHRGTD
jgi:1-acyl-sn-glycerol-3-phosphate acyltransferase